MGNLFSGINQKMVAEDRQKLWNSDLSDENFNELVILRVNNTDLVVKSGIMKLYMPDLKQDMNDTTSKLPVYTMTMSLDGTMMNSEDAITVVSNLLNHNIKVHNVLLKYNKRTVGETLFNYICMHKFIIDHMSKISNYFIRQRVLSFADILKKYISSQFTIFKYVCKFLNGGYYMKSGDDVFDDLAQEHIIAALNLGNKFTTYGGAMTKFNGKSCLPLTQREDTGNIYFLIRKLVVALQPFKMDTFRNEFVEYAKNYKADDEVINLLIGEYKE